ncbi:MAG: hypothetical protein AAGF98_00185 [Cyanobacteria bacterium P01_H01_bin.153]
MPLESRDYSPIGEQKRLEQTPQRYGNRISTLGLWQPTQGFEYDLAQGGFKGKSYIKAMDGVAQKASQTLAETVIVQDSDSLQKAVWCSNSVRDGRKKGCSSSSYPPSVRR